MPTSIDPQPGENELECARCGAIFFYQLTHCPKCGVDLYEPQEEDEHRPSPLSTMDPHNRGVLAGLTSFLSSLFSQKRQDEYFSRAVQAQATLYQDLLRKVGGDYEAAGRLIDFEARRLPDGDRTTWLESANRRWDRDNT